MKIYWIKAQAPRRVLARLPAEFDGDLLARIGDGDGRVSNIVRWIDGLMRIPAWAEPWPAGRAAAA